MREREISHGSGDANIMNYEVMRIGSRFALLADGEGKCIESRKNNVFVLDSLLQHFSNEWSSCVMVWEPNVFT